GLRGPRGDARRVRACRARALSLLQLRRRDVRDARARRAQRRTRGRRCARDPAATDVLMHFALLGQDGTARRGRLTFARGTIETPAFMPVGTYGSVKAMTPEELESL